MSQDRTYQQTIWELDELFPAPDAPELQAAFQSLEADVNDFEQLRPTLSESITSEDFLDIVKRLESLGYRSNLISAYANLLFSQDTQDQTAMGLMARVEQFMAEMGNRTLFFSLWWKDLPDHICERLYKDTGDLRYWLEEIRHFKPHTLSEAEEKIINIKNVTGVNALALLYDTVTNRYTFSLAVDGETKEMTRGELSVYVRHADPRVREQTYQELYRVYGNDGPILGNIYQTMVRDWHNEQIGLRMFSSPIAARNLANDVPDSVVDTLLEICQRNTGIFQRFFSLKARSMGMERLRRYDIYAPLTKSDKSYSFQEAADIVMDSFRDFDPEIADLAFKVFEQNHLDSEVRNGKRSGAFCLTAVQDKTPWVQVNYQGKVNDVSTLAHELGHAVHSMLASHHSLFTAHASLPLAETASTFGEMLLLERMLKEETSEDVRRDMLFSQVDDAYATIQRQAYFALFERKAHEMVQQGASVADLSQAYLENLEAQFGGQVEIADEFRWEWVSIPHIYHVPFYVYAYSFGQLLVLALFKQYKSEGAAFKPGYKTLLAAGGSASPASILRQADIDIHQAAFWQGGFDVLSDLVTELEKIKPGP